MEFFGIGPLEILVILIVVLIAFGPDRLPELVRNIAKFIQSFRKVTFDLTREVTNEFKDLEAEAMREKNLLGQDSPEVKSPPKKRPRKPRRTQDEATGSEQ
jgi:Tat protein translocase TatB subunit